MTASDPRPDAHGADPDGRADPVGPTHEAGAADEAGAAASDRSDVTGTAGATAARPGGARSLLRSRWWRVGGASLALCGLVWGASAVGGAQVGLQDPQRADRTGATAGPADLALVGSAALACPGAGERSQAPLRVVAAAAPSSVFVGSPEELDDGSDGSPATAAPSGRDDASVTTSPAGAREVGDDAAVTSAAPDAGGAGDDAAVTSAAPDAGGVGDDAAVTSAAPDTGPSVEDDPDEGGVGESEADAGGAELVLSGDRGERWALRPPEPRTVELDGPAAAFVLGQGGDAPGLVGAQLAAGTDAGTRGAALAPCVQPAEELWLVGGDGRAGGTEQLVLTNPGADPVTVAVRVWGAEGEVGATGATGLVVPPRGRVDRLLDALAPGAEAPVLSVTATGGPVAAHLNLLVRDGTTDLGAGTVSPAAAPATDLVVPALPTAPEGSVQQVALRVLAPGDDEAVVDLTALTEDGAVRLPDLVTRVPAGRTVPIALDELPAGTTGLRLRADAPVVAAAGLEIAPAEGEPEETGTDGAVATRAPADDAAATTAPGDDATDATAGPRDRRPGEPLLRTAGELAWVSATTLSAGPVGSGLPDPGAVPGGTARLVLSAVDATTVTVHWLDEDGRSSTDVVDLPNDTGRALAVPAGARAVWLTTTDPSGEGPGAGVVAAVHVTGADGRGPLVASTTLPAVPWTSTVTTVRPAVP